MGRDTNSSWINKQINGCCSFLAPLVESSLRTTARPKIGAQGLWHCLGHSWPTRSIKKRGSEGTRQQTLRCCLGHEERAGRRGRAQKGAGLLLSRAPAETDQGCLGNLLHIWISRSPEGPEKSKFYCLLQFVHADYSELEDQVFVKGLLPRFLMGK